MRRMSLMGAVFVSTVLGCTVPLSTTQLLDVAQQGLAQAIANQEAAQGRLQAALDSQAQGLLEGVESDLRSHAQGDQVGLKEALELVRAHHAQMEALGLARQRSEADGRRAIENLQAVREAVEQARRLVVYSSSLEANVRSYLDVVTRKGGGREQTQ